MFSNDTLKITTRIKNIKSLFPFNVFMKINAATIIKTINGKCKLAKCLWPFIKKISECLNIDDIHFEKLTYPLAVAFGAKSLEEIN